MHASCNAVQFNWAEARSEEKRKAGLLLLEEPPRLHYKYRDRQRERKGEEYRRVLFGTPAANWSNFASQTIVYRPKGEGQTRILFPSRAK